MFKIKNKRFRIVWQLIGIYCWFQAGQFVHSNLPLTLKEQSKNMKISNSVFCYSFNVFDIWPTYFTIDFTAACSAISTITGGTVTLLTSGTVTTAKYSCDQGYSLDGFSTLTCQSTGTWNTVQSQCGMCQFTLTLFIIK